MLPLTALPMTTRDAGESCASSPLLFFWRRRQSSELLGRRGRKARAEKKKEKMQGPLIGVLALQGAFEEHQKCLEAIGCRTVQVGCLALLRPFQRIRPMDLLEGQPRALFQSRVRYLCALCFSPTYFLGRCLFFTRSAHPTTWKASRASSCLVASQPLWD